LLTAINFDTWNARTITCDTSFGADAELHDYTGRHPDIRTNGQGQATFRVPSNGFHAGQSYLCFSRAGCDAPVRRIARPTIQTFFGASDLDTAPATPGRSVQPGRIWCRAGTPIRAELAITPHGGMGVGDVSFAVLSPSGETIAASTERAHGV